MLYYAVLQCSNYRAVGACPAGQALAGPMFTQYAPLWSATHYKIIILISYINKFTTKHPSTKQLAHIIAGLTFFARPYNSGVKNYPSCSVENDLIFQEFIIQMK